MNLTDCQCNEQQPTLICFSCWRKGVRHKDKLPESTSPTLCPVPPIVNVVPIPEKLLRYKAAGILDCTCTPAWKSRFECAKHKEFYGTRNRSNDDSPGSNELPGLPTETGDGLPLVGELPSDVHYSGQDNEFGK